MYISSSLRSLGMEKRGSTGKEKNVGEQCEVCRDASEWVCGNMIFYMASFSVDRAVACLNRSKCSSRSIKFRLIMCMMSQPGRRLGQVGLQAL